jgi:hypothetical protein
MGDLSPFALVVKDKALSLSYARCYPGLDWSKATPIGRVDAESRLSADDVLRALDGLIGEFVAGVHSGRSTTGPSEARG